MLIPHTFTKLPLIQSLSLPLVVIASGAMLEHMTEKKKEPEHKLEPEDYEIYHDPIGVTHFLPPKRCKTCED
jgi:hypothetical protein